jgi:hypothetical protein
LSPYSIQRQSPCPAGSILRSKNAPWRLPPGRAGRLALVEVVDALGAPPCEAGGEADAADLGFRISTMRAAVSSKPPAPLHARRSRPCAARSRSNAGFPHQSM